MFRLPVFEVLGLHLGHLAAGEVKDLLAQQLEDDHVVLTEALAGPTRTHNVADEGGPVFGPLLLKDLGRVQRIRALSPKSPCHIVSKHWMFAYLHEDHVQF